MSAAQLDNAQRESAPTRPAGIVAAVLGGLLAAAMILVALPGTATAASSTAGSGKVEHIDWNAVGCSDQIKTRSGGTATVADVLASDDQAQHRQELLLKNKDVVAHLKASGAGSESDVQEVAGILAASFESDEAVEAFTTAVAEKADAVGTQLWPWQLKCNKARAAYALHQGMGTGICAGIGAGTGGLGGVVCNLVKSAAGGKINWNKAC